MKGGRLHINFLIPVALVTGIWMAVLGIMSWSQGADTPYEWMLYVILGAISAAFLHAYHSHPNKERYITKGLDIKLKHSFVTTAYLFIGVGVFSVWATEALHLIFTGLAIINGYFTLVTYPESKKGRIWAIIGAIIGIGGFLLGYKFGFWSVAWGEVIAAFPLAVQMFITLNYRD